MLDIPGLSPRDRASPIPRYYELLRLRNRCPPPRRTRRLARWIESGVVPDSSAPPSPLYLCLPFPTCLPRRPRRRLRAPTVIRHADIGLHHHTSDSATPVQFHVEAHLLWFIFIQAHRFYARTAYSPRPLAGPTGTGPFRREPFNSTGGTCTHERNHLRGLLRCDWKCGSAGATGRKSGRGQPHSKTLREIAAALNFRQPRKLSGLECGL
jgi:hypothetical protein